MSSHCCLINVYLPYGNSTYESLDNYMQIIAELSATIKNCSTHEMVIMGDFNADFKRRFDQELRIFASENEVLVFYTVLIMDFIHLL